MKKNYIKIMNEMVKNYVFRNPDKITYEGKIKSLNFFNKFKLNNSK